MEHTTTSSGSTARGNHGPTGKSGSRVLLRLPDLTPRPSRTATAKPPTAPGDNKPADTAKTPPPAAGPPLSIHKPPGDKATTTTIHGAHAGPRPSQATAAGAAHTATKQPPKFTKPASSKSSASKPKSGGAQPFLLLILVGVACGVLVGVIATRANKSPTAPDSPPPAWNSVEAGPATDGTAGESNPGNDIPGGVETGPSLGRSVPAIGDRAATEGEAGRPTAVEPSLPKRPVFDEPVYQSPRDQIPGVARLNGRIEVESHGGTQR
jgi:hypothetical protein